MKTIWMILVACLVAACGSKPQAKNDEVGGKGLIEGNGGSGLSYRSNPWFLGDQAVQYCIKVSPEFSVSERDIKTIVIDVIAGWTTVIDKLIDDEARTLLNAAGLKFTKFYTLSDTCSNKTDLVFSFGALDHHIEQAIKYNSKNLVAFASLAEYDLTTMRGRGAVYIAPDSGQNAYHANGVGTGFWDTDRLFDVLLHEFGHVMGFQHDETSFMAEYYPGYRVALNRKGRLSTDMLVTRHAITTGYSTLCGRPWYSNGDQDFVDSFVTAKNLCFHSEPVNNTLTIETADADEKLSFSIKNLDGGGSAITSRIFTASQEYQVATYADDHAWHGSMTNGNTDIPLTISLQTEGFILNLYDEATKSWSEVTALSDKLRLVNDVDP